MKPQKSSNHRFSLLLLLLFLFSFSLQFHPCAASSSSSSPSRDPTQQLINFKATLPNPSLLPNWLPNQNPCSFTGITCNQTSLTAIDLTNIPLSTNLTAVATYLLTLDHLQILTLKYTNLTGAAAGAHRCGSSLTTIDLSQNALSGSFSDLSFLASCSNLQSLNISNNNLEFDSPRWRLGLSVQVLDLSYNKISGPNFLP